MDLISIGTVRSFINLFLDLTYDVFNLLLYIAAFGVLVVLLSLLLKRFMRKSAAVTVSIITVTAGAIMLVYQYSHTTFDELAEDQVNEERLRTLSITVYDTNSPDSRMERVASLTIDDEEIIRQVLEDFSGTRLRRDADSRPVDWEYRIQITSTSRFSFNADANFIDNLKIVEEDSGHLSTIEELVGREDLDWQYEDTE